MKKILTIVALALVLCLAISALAEVDPRQYKAVFRGNFNTSVEGYPILTEAQIQDKSNWAIVNKNTYTIPDSPSVPSSDEVPASDTLARNILNTLQGLVLSSAKAEELPTVVKITILGTMVHGQPNQVNIEASNGYSYEVMVMIAGNDHTVKAKAEYQVLEDGFCHSRGLCTQCDYHTDWSEKPDHDIAKITKKVVDGETIVYCTKCGQEVRSTNSHAHEKVVVWDEMPTCENGLKGKYHLECGVEGCYSLLVEDRGELYVTDDFEAAQVTADRATFLADPQNSEWATLAKKGYYDVKGNFWGDWALSKPADCLNAGLLARSCYWCDNVETKFDAEKYPAKGHRYATVTVACDSDKKITLTCIYCNGLGADDTSATAVNKTAKAVLAKGVSDQTPATLAAYKGPDGKTSAIVLTHTYDLNKDPDYTEKATCTKGGKKIWNCIKKNCIDKANGKYVLHTAELGHKWGEWVTVVEPAENVRGIWIRTCSRCLLTDRRIDWFDPNLMDNCEHPEEAIEIWDKVEPTCTEDGYVDWFCTLCGFEGIEELPALGHDFDEPVTIKDATCEEDGIAVGKCKVCGFYGESVVKATGHNLVYHAKVEATCKDEGVAEYYECSICGKLFGDKEEKVELKSPVTIAKTTDHKWDDGKVTKKPTTEAKGEKTYTCTVCGETKIVEIDKELPTAKYTLSDVVYDGDKVTGKAAHVEGTDELPEVYARITFFFADGTYGVIVKEVKADGSFQVGMTFNTVHVAVQIISVDDVTPPKTDAIYGNANAKMENK